MVEVRYFPSLDVVTLGALCAEAAFVGIGVARGTGRRLCEVRFRRVFVLHERAQRGKHMRGGVAFLALYVGVFAFQFVPGQTVIEFLLGWLPTDQIEVLAVMLEVAAHTILAVRILHLHLGVITVFIGESFGDFLVAIETFIGGSAGAKLMTGVALRRTAEGRMCF